MIELKPVICAEVGYEKERNKGSPYVSPFNFYCIPTLVLHN